MNDKLIEELGKELDRLHIDLTLHGLSEKERDKIFQMLDNLHQAFKTHYIIPANSDCDLFY